MNHTPMIIAPDQSFNVGKFKEYDVKGIVNLFIAVYGEHYPIRTYYNPKKIIEENTNKNVYTMVARTVSGDIIGHLAFYRSSPHNPNLYEIGIMLILPSYRTSFAAYELMSYAMENYIYSLNVDAVYGEAVCNLTATQKMSDIMGLSDTGIELGLMPASAYDTEKSAHGRVSCVLSFKVFREERQVLYLPERYVDRARFAMADFTPERQIKVSSVQPSKDSKTGASEKYFSFAQALRVNVYDVGADFQVYADSAEKTYLKKGAEVLQFFINLKDHWAPYAVTCLADKGYYMAAMLPCWFETDGILMMKNVKADLSEILLHSDKAK